MKIQKQISQRWNPFSDFPFDRKSEMRILNLNPDFPIERTINNECPSLNKAIVAWTSCLIQLTVYKLP